MREAVNEIIKNKFTLKPAANKYSYGLSKSVLNRKIQNFKKLGRIYKKISILVENMTTTSFLPMKRNAFWNYISLRVLKCVYSLTINEIRKLEYWNAAVNQK